MPVDHAREGFIATDDGERLYYRVDGNGAPLVVVHGGPGFSMSYLRPSLLPFARARMLISYDQRGSGRSSLVADDAKLTFTKHVDDIESMRRHFGLARLSLLGHSWGAAPAAGYAMHFPERVDELVLVCPLPPRQVPYRDEFVRNRRARLTPEEGARFDDLAAAFPSAPAPGAALREVLALYFRAFVADPEIAARIPFGDDPPEAIRNEARVDALTMASLGDYDWRESLSAIRAKTLVIHGDADPIPLASAQEWAAHIPGAEFVLIKNCGHFPQIERPAAFLAVVEGFLA